MKKVLFIFLLYGGHLLAQIPSLLEIPKELIVGANSVVLSESREMIIKSPEQAQLQRTLLIAVLNEASEEQIHYAVYDDASKIKSFKGTIYNSFGQEVRAVRKDEIRDYLAVEGGISDTRYRRMEVQYGEYPYLLKVELDIRLSGLIFISYLDWMLQSYNQSILDAQYVLRLPPGMELPYQVMNSEMLPVKEQNGEEMVWTFRVQNLPAVQPEAYSPPSSQILPQVLIFPENFAIEEYQGDLSTWKGFGAFVHQLYQGRQELPPELKAEVQAILAKTNNKQEQIEALYQLMQKRMRYVSIQLGLGGWQPFAADFVEENRFGDCKALTNYMSALLAEADIESYPVLIERRDRPSYQLDETFTFSPFNHVILYVPKEEVWLECTSNSYPVNYLGYDNEGRQGLLIDANGGRLIETPITIAEQNARKTRIKVFLNTDGSARIKGLERHQNHFYQDWQWRANYWSPQEQQDYFLEQINPKNVSVNQVEISIDREEKRADVQLDLEVPRYASKAGKRIFVPLNGLNPLGQVPEKMDERKQAIFLSRSRIFEDSIRIQLPKELAIEALPDAVDINSFFGSYHQQTRVEGDYLIYTKRLLIRKGSYDPSAYEEFRDFFKQVSRAENGKLVLLTDRS
ncbi:MAG: DUF3857 domain-containing protein [Bacteroidota bacterium]